MRDLLTRCWWQPRPPLLAQMLRPLAWLYGRIAARQRRRTQPVQAPVPVLVVGNVVVGGAGKTPAVIAVVQALQAAGHRPGVVSRGYGRRRGEADTLRPVQAHDDPAQCGDEPLLIARRTGVPVQVGRDRSAAVAALCAACPQVDVIVSDDGLQHHRLARQAELIVFDDRGIGNGLLLPAGPLREPLPTGLTQRQRVLYTGSRTSTALAGFQARPRADRAWLLDAWRGGPVPADAATAERPRAAVAIASEPAAARTARGGVPIAALRGRPLLAVAGLADPTKFFRMLRAAGLQIDTLALPDHHAYRTLPWPAGTPEVVTTEKDAIKLDPARLAAPGTAGTRIWVVPLDLDLPPALIDDLLDALFATRQTRQACRGDLPQA